MGLDHGAQTPVIPVTVIATVFNEGPPVLEMLDSVLTGNATPEELVVADGGSTDGTVELIEDYARSHPQVRVIHDAGGRSAGRNAAIAAASHDHIVSIDGGCLADPDWLEKITEPLLKGHIWVAGFYRPEGETALSTAIGLTMVYVEEEVQFPGYLPSARSMAFDRQVWKAVGGFPEDAQFAEDTAFGQMILDAGHVMTFVPDAVVAWQPPAGLTAQTKTTFAWGRGDGLLGLRSWSYRHLLSRFLALGMLLLAGIAFPLLLIPTLLGVGAYAYRNSRRKYRHMESWLKWIWIPLATLNGLASSLAGYITGYLERRWGERGIASQPAGVGNGQLGPLLQPATEWGDPAAPVGGLGMPAQIESLPPPQLDGGVDRSDETLGI
jgi:cellulose synthase/poly-beta-1,6-N-acetylglucosamine synthase-like glycosyltransferase